MESNVNSLDKVEDNLAIFSYGKKPEVSVTHFIDFEVNEFEGKLFIKDLEAYLEKVKEDFYRQNHIFQLGIYFGENSFKYIYVGISLIVPGRMIFITDNNGLPMKAAYNKTTEFLTETFGFNVVKDIPVGEGSQNE